MDKLSEERLRIAADIGNFNQIGPGEKWHGLSEEQYKDLQDRVWKQLKSRFEKRRLLFQDMFRIVCDHSHDTKLGKEELFKAVDGSLNMGFSDTEKMALFDRVFPRGVTRMSLDDFIKICEGTSTFLLANSYK